ncbi:hypothetical protein AVEN_209184-1, partial [Araneus ventricosus]
MNFVDSSWVLYAYLLSCFSFPPTSEEITEQKCFLYLTDTSAGRE